MSFLSVPPRHGNLFQSDKSFARTAQRIFERKRAQKAGEYLNRNTRDRNIDDDDKVVINVGGTIYKSRKTTLRNVPGTKLSELNEASEHYDRNNNEYYFDRNPFLFSYILDYYRSGAMHIPRNICSIYTREELRFWGLGDGCISECCSKYYFDELDDNTTFEYIKDEFYSLQSNIDTQSEEMLKQSPFQRFRQRAWVFIDNHGSSMAAKIFAVFYYGLIVVTILNLFISTIPPIRQPLQKHLLIRQSGDITPEFNYTKSISGTMKIVLTTDPPDSLVILDLCCLIFFTLEFLFRLVVSPSIKQRFQSWYTLLDILYLVPAWTRLLIDVSSPFYWQQGYRNATLLVVLDAIVVLRVFRIFRVFRHYRGLRVLLLAIKASVSELMLLIVFVVFSLVIYASLAYCAEQYSETGDFESMFKGLWWALITLTTVGYGDTYPVTTGGRIIACLCAVTGLLIIGMVVPIIAGNFHLYYGFRYAGLDGFEHFKPEFVPTEEENPIPDMMNETFVPKDRRMSTMMIDEAQINFAGLSGPGATESLRSLRSNTMIKGDHSPRSGGSPNKMLKTNEVSPMPGELSGVKEETV
ncbi:Potassium voltage-gated channel subfamily B member 1 [Mactra antiquata]